MMERRNNPAGEPCRDWKDTLADVLMLLAIGLAGVDVFAQPYRDFENSIEPTKQMRDFARWVNRKEIFKSVDTFADYKKNRS